MSTLLKVGCALAPLLFEGRATHAAQVRTWARAHWPVGAGVAQGVAALCALLLLEAAGVQGEAPSAVLLEVVVGAVAPPLCLLRQSQAVQHGFVRAL